MESAEHEFLEGLLAKASRSSCPHFGLIQRRFRETFNKPVSLDTLQSIFSDVNRQHVRVTHHKVKAVAPEVARVYAAGRDVLDIAADLDFPPVSLMNLLAAHILQPVLAGRKIGVEWRRSPDSMRRFCLDRMRGADPQTSKCNQLMPSDGRPSWGVAGFEDVSRKGSDWPPPATTGPQEPQARPQEANPDGMELPNRSIAREQGREIPGRSRADLLEARLLGGGGKLVHIDSAEQLGGAAAEQGDGVTPAKLRWGDEEGCELDEKMVDRIAADMRRCARADRMQSPYGDFMRSLVGIEFEVRLRQELEAQNLHHWGEQELRTMGLEKTPDIKLKVPFMVDGVVVNWIDSKAMFGSRAIHESNMQRQFHGYISRYGSGMCIYWFGYVKDAASLSRKVKVVDSFPPASIILTLPDSPAEQQLVHKRQDPSVAPASA